MTHSVAETGHTLYVESWVHANSFFFFPGSILSFLVVKAYHTLASMATGVRIWSIHGGLGVERDKKGREGSNFLLLPKNGGF